MAELYYLLDAAFAVAGWPAASGPTARFGYVVASLLALWGLVLVARTFDKNW